MLKIGNRTFKEINNRHTMICIEDVVAIAFSLRTNNNDSYMLRFYTKGDNDYFLSDGFMTEEEAIKFRNDIMGWGMTNREKYIDNVSNGELAKLLATGTDGVACCTDTTTG